MLVVLTGLAGLGAAEIALAGETPKRGGVLTYMIPADAPPSSDGHRESTYDRDRCRRQLEPNHLATGRRNQPTTGLFPDGR